MKTTIEVHGFEIKIDEMEGKVLVSAMKDGETIEEFELEVEGFEGSDEDMDDMEPFGQGEEEEDFGGEEEEDDMEEDDMEEEAEEEAALESFSAFFKKAKKK